MASSNGKAKPGLLRTVAIDLGHDFPGWHATMRLNLKIRDFQEFTSGEIKRVIAVLPRMIVDWNFVGEDGQELGPPSDETFAELDTDVLNALITAYGNAITEAATVPNAPAAPSSTT